MADTSNNLVGSGLAGSLVSGISSIWGSTLANDGKEITGKYETALAELNNNAALSLKDKELAITKLNNAFAAEKTTLETAQKKNSYVFMGILVTVLAITAIVIVLIVKRSQKSG